MPDLASVSGKASRPASAAGAGWAQRRRQLGRLGGKSRDETRRVSRQTLLSCDCERGRAGREKRGREADALHLVQLVVARGASCGDGGRILYRRRRDDPGPGRGSSPLAGRPALSVVSYVLSLPSPGVFLCARPPPHPHTPAATCRQPRPHRCHRRHPRAVLLMAPEI